MNKILCSTGALVGRPNGREFTLLKDICPNLRCDGLELMMYDTWYNRIDEMKDFFPSLPMKIYTFHLEKQIGELISHYRLDEALEKMELNCALAKDLGAELLVLHLWNGIISDKNIDYNIDCYKYLWDIAKSYDLTLTVENVVCSQKDPFTHLLTLLEKYPQISFTFDTKMAQFHRQLELLYNENGERLFENVAHIHMNDYGGGYMEWSNLRVLPIGCGNVDFDAFFDFIKRKNYKGNFTLEATCFDQSGKILLDGLNKSIDIIKERLFNRE